MTILVVRVTPECEGLIRSLPSFEKFNLIGISDKTDAASPHYDIELSFEDNDISALTEESLNTNPDVISYRIMHK